MKKTLLQHIVCPTCEGLLDLTVEAQDELEIERGRLDCRKCAQTYQIIKGIPRFVQTDAYVGNFSFEWNLHRKTQVDSIAGHSESQKTFEEKTGFTEAQLKGKLALDAGSGTGRFMEIAAKFGAEVIGVDLSYAVDAAYANMGRRPGIHIVQADLFRLPFPPATFEAIYSIGVLHHTPNTREAFLRLPPLLKPSGVVAIWVYVWAGDYSRRLDKIRKFTVGLPKRLLYAICAAWVPIYYVMNRIPLLRRLACRIPTSNQGCGLAWDILDTFDNYSPKYQWKHTEVEVRGWFQEARLQDVSVLGFPVAMRGRRPAL